MASVDYGAIIKKNGVFLNKGKDLFQDMKTEIGIEIKSYKGNYFVYAGDEDFFICFYKTRFIVVSNGKEILCHWPEAFKRQKFFNLGEQKIDVEVEYLDKLGILDVREPNDHNWDSDKFLDRRLRIRKHRALKSIYRDNKKQKRFSPLTFKATWEYKGDQYEVVYGYGIDPNLDEDIMMDYGYTEAEREEMKKWF